MPIPVRSPSHRWGLGALLAVVVSSGCFDPAGIVTVEHGGDTTGGGNDEDAVDDGYSDTSDDTPDDSGPDESESGADDPETTGGPTDDDDCGDGLLDDGEECDLTNLDGLATCADVGLGLETEPLACTSMCTLDFGACSACGDGVVTSPETCETDVLGGATCRSLGFSGGTLTCTDCGYDTSGCDTCGDGVLGATEACDGAELGAATCESQGFSGGTLGCAADCTFDVGACQGQGCGDGVVDGPEECDGSAGGHTCLALTGLPDGDVGCTAACTLDTSDCSGPSALRVFVTSGAFATNFGGALGADDVCQSVAEDAGLAGTFSAWVSDDSTTPAERFNHSDGAYQLLDGTIIANDWNDLVDGQIAAAIGIDESGQAIDPSSTTVATATTESGDAQPFNGNCANWTSTSASQTLGVGNEENMFTWSSSGAVGCSTLVALYCFEQ